MSDSNDESYDLVPDAAPSKRTSLPGTAASLPTPPAAPAAATGAKQSCPYCGFTFLGKPRARCPECSAALDNSTNDTLQFASAGWLGSLSKGSTLITIAIALHTVGSILRWFSAPAKGVAHAAGALLLAAGVFLIMRKENAKDMGRRLLANVLAMASLLLWIMFMLRATGLMQLQWVNVKACLETTLLSQALLAVMLGFYLQGIAQRIPDDSLAGQAVVFGSLVACVCVLMAGLQLLDMTTSVHLMFFMCSFPLIAGVLVILGWSMLILLRFKVNLRAAADEAQTITANRQMRQAAKSGR